MRALWVAYAVSLSLSCLAPFVNQYIQEVYGVGLNIIYVFTVVFSFLVFIVEGTLGKQINKASISLYLILTMLILVNVNSEIGNGFISAVIGVLSSLPLLFVVPMAFYKVFRLSTLVFGFIFLALVLSDVNAVVAAVMLHSRSAFENSPISLSILAGILILAITCSRNRRLVLHLPVLLILLLVMLFTGSRGPLIFLMMVFFIKLYKEGKIYLIGVMTISGGVALAYLLSVRNNTSSSSSARLDLYQEALNIVEKNPFGTFDTSYFFRVTELPFPHNFFLDLYTNTNVFLVAFFIIMGMLLLFWYVRTKFTKYSEESVCEFPVLLFVFVILCCQVSLPSIEMLRVIIPIMFIVISQSLLTNRHARLVNKT